jgi:hypothetical protein
MIGDHQRPVGKGDDLRRVEEFGAQEAGMKTIGSMESRLMGKRAGSGFGFQASGRSASSM